MNFVSEKRLVSCNNMQDIIWNIKQDVTAEQILCLRKWLHNTDHKKLHTLTCKAMENTYTNVYTLYCMNLWGPLVCCYSKLGIEWANTHELRQPQLNEITTFQAHFELK